MNKELITRYEKSFGKSKTSQLLKQYKKIALNKHIRINTSQTTINTIKKEFERLRIVYQRTFLQNAIQIHKTHFNLSSTLLALSGKIYIQDLASQIPVNCIDMKLFKEKKVIKILDMAASPGSKTTQLVDLFESHSITYEITALEPEKKRLTKLINNIQRQECKNISIYNVTGQAFETQEKFDLILLDAPCSGNLVGDKNWLEKRTVSGIKKMAALQKELLQKASTLLNSKGILIYSTCSIEPEENEENVKWALKELPLQSTKTSLSFPFSTKTLFGPGYRFFPTESQTQGFFVCLFERKKN